VPLLALAGSWPVVVVLVGLERLGKAVRSPARSKIAAGTLLASAAVVALSSRQPTLQEQRATMVEGITG